jgi:nicotinate-nucleotide adenylyltransferase
LTTSVATRSHGQPRSIALFGGTFDPIHSGHIAVAQAARRRFHLDAIYFIPSSRPPHKTKMTLTPFAHRYAQVALACENHEGFLPSLAEAPPDATGTHVFYSLDTVRKFKKEFPLDHLYFILGADQFLEIPTWRHYETLLDCCDFIIANRPGFRMDALRLVIPPEMRARVASRDANKIALRKSNVYLLSTVRSHISSTEVRQRLHQGKPVDALVPASVQEYIRRQGLYQ